MLTGVADLPDANLLSVRLPATLNPLTATIISQFEREILHPDPR
jgi:hypothetical protein